MSLQGKVVIVTGASSGIGLACARALAKQGAKVVIAARSVDKLAQIEEELKNQGTEILSVAVDVTSEEDCRILVEKTVGRFGGIDVLINNAGISMRAMFVDLDLNVLKRLMDVNFWGAVYCTKYALPYILKNRGSVVGVSSIAGFKGLPARTGYSASKFALYGFLDTLRVEYLRQGLHVMVIAPGFTSSNIRRTALSADGSCQGESPREEGKMMSAEKVADHLIKGILHKKRTVILTAEGKAVMFLKSFFPALLDRLEYQFMSREPDSPFK